MDNSSDNSSQTKHPQGNNVVNLSGGDNSTAGGDNTTLSSTKERLENLQLPIDEYVEEVGEGDKKVKRSGVYLLPNLLTTAALFAGFYSIVNAMNAHYEAAALAIIVAGFFDGLDGRLARLTNTASAFGEQYDSLSDMVSFGLAPAILIFSWALTPLGQFGWAAGFIYVAGAALRLARFNANLNQVSSTFFQGLASPAAAGLISSFVWFFNEDTPMLNVSFELSVVASIITILAGILMITNIPYNSFKGIDLRGRVPFAGIILVALMFGVISIHPPLILFLIGVIYLLSGPLTWLYKALFARKE